MRRPGEDEQQQATQLGRSSPAAPGGERWSTPWEALGLAEQREALRARGAAGAAREECEERRVGP